MERTFRVQPKDTDMCMIRQQALTGKGQIMKIEITQKDIFLNNLKINKESEPTTLLNTRARIKNLDLQNKLFILDENGIKYWTQNKIITEIQICLNENGRSEIFPAFDYLDSITINGTTINRQTKVDDEIVEKLNLTLDDDNLRFKVFTYFFKNEFIRYSLTLDDERLITHISFSFIN